MVCPRSAGRSQLPRTARAAFGWDSGAAVSRVTATAVSLCSPKPTVRRLETLARSDFDRTGRLWIGGLGVSRVDNPESERPTFVRYTTSQGLASNYVHSLAEDLSGRMYLGMTSGVDRLDPVTGVVRHFALPDGLSGSEVEVAFCDRHGTLWFGTARGLASLVPLPDGPASPPTVFIGGLRISGETRSISELGETQVQALELGPSQNQVQIDYFSISMTSPGVRYQVHARERGPGLERADRTAQRQLRESVTRALSPSSFGRSRRMGLSVLYRQASASRFRRPSAASVVSRVGRGLDDGADVRSAPASGQPAARAGTGANAYRDRSARRHRLEPDANCHSQRGCRSGG